MLSPILPAIVAHIRRTEHRRYWLLLARDPATWLPILGHEAAKPWPPPIGTVSAGPLADPPLYLSAPQPDPDGYRRALATASRCPYGEPTDWDIAGCGCGSSRRCWRLARKVAPSECVICIST